MRQPARVAEAPWPLDGEVEIDLMESITALGYESDPVAGPLKALTDLLKMVRETRSRCFSTCNVAIASFASQSRLSRETSSRNLDREGRLFYADG
jgi:hypothetical protein